MGTRMEMPGAIFPQKLPMTSPPPKPQLPCSFLQMRYGVGGVQYARFLQTSQSWAFSFLILSVGQHKFFGQPKPMLLHNSILKEGSSIWHVAHDGLESILHELFKRGETQILPVISNFTQGFCGFVYLFVFTLLKLCLRVLGGSVGFKLKCEGLRLDLQLPRKSLAWPVTSALWGTEAGDSLGLAANLVKNSASSKVLWQALTQGNITSMNTPIYTCNTHKIKGK